jgi:hypothetical protein
MRVSLTEVWREALLGFLIVAVLITIPKPV